MKTTQWYAILLGAVFTALVAGGCPQMRLGPCPERYASLEQLLYAYNQNAAMVPNLWSRSDVTVYLTTRTGGNRLRTADYRIDTGHLFVGQPTGGAQGVQNFRVQGKAGSTEVFRLGQSAEAGVYYFMYNVPGGESGSYWGRVHGDEAASGGWDPSQLLSVLAITPWPDRSDSPPFPVLTTLRDPCVYQIEFLGNRPGGGSYVQRVVWLDRRADQPRPIRVWLYDVRGRTIMSARMENYKTIAAAGGAPVMPTLITADWPLNVPQQPNQAALTRMVIRLRDMKTQAVPASYYAPPEEVMASGRRLDASGAPTETAAGVAQHGNP